MLKTERCEAFTGSLTDTNSTDGEVAQASNVQKRVLVYAGASEVATRTEPESIPIGPEWAVSRRWTEPKRVLGWSRASGRSANYFHLRKRRQRGDLCARTRDQRRCDGELADLGRLSQPARDEREL